MEIPVRRNRRRAISGIIGAVILFTLLFTIGSEYFIFVNNVNNLETQALVNRGNAIANRLQESIQIIPSLNASSYLRFYINNTGGITVNITSMMILSSTGVELGCYGIGYSTSLNCGNTTPALPLVANPGAGAPRHSYVVSSYSYTSGTVVLKLFASDGSSYSATYPAPATELAAEALSSGAIGDLYLNFHSYQYYTVSACNGIPLGTQLSGTGNYSSGECLTSGTPAFAISHTNTADIGFSVQVTNLNNQSYDIVLDQFSLLYQVLQGPSAKGTYYAWYISSVFDQGGQQVVTESFNPVVLVHNVPTTLYFVASACVTSSEGPSSSTCSLFTNQVQVSSCQQISGCTNSGGYVSTVFIISHGWEMDPPVTVSALSYTGTNSPNYGQNSPYVSSLYY